ncbi:MAG: hypothetical protein KDA60_10425 [Planctomycetales bacterium]|nr:hypothetical protein [Planctomycetales bacterium]
MSPSNVVGNDADAGLCWRTMTGDVAESAPGRAAAWFAGATEAGEAVGARGQRGAWVLGKGAPTQPANNTIKTTAAN